jgi:hypothetical protein
MPVKSALTIIALQSLILSPVVMSGTANLTGSTSKASVSDNFKGVHNSEVGVAGSLSGVEELSDVGLYGLAVMGQNFALNMAENGLKVSVGNRSPPRVRATTQRAANEGNLPVVGYDSMEGLVRSLKRPRKIVLLVQAGAPVDETVGRLSEMLEVSLIHSDMKIRQLFM